MDTAPQKSASPNRLTFWGVRGSIATPGASTVYYGGNTSCVELRADGEIIILDAGTGIRPLGLALAKEFQDRPLELTLLITHTHWDHIQGFPYFVPAYNARNKIRILGCETARGALAATIAGQMADPYFPIPLKRMSCDLAIEGLNGARFTVGAVLVETTPVNHPGEALGYRLTTQSGSIAYLPDNEPFACGSDSATAEEAKRRHRQLVEFLRAVDVLIIDSQYEHDEYPEHVGWGHGCLDDVVSLAIEAGAKKLFLFHHDPDHDDARITSMLAHARGLAAACGATIGIEAAREGLSVELA